MSIYQQCAATVRLDKVIHQGDMHVETSDDEASPQYRAVIDSSPLHGTQGGEATSVMLALDFLHLAMQAQGADEIAFSCQPRDDEVAAAS